MARILLIPVACWLAVGHVRADDDTAPCVAVYESGRRVTGDHIEGWARPDDTPKLDGQPLFVEDDALRWIGRQSRESTQPRPPFIEMVTGDRLPSVVVAWLETDASLSQPPHFVVAPHVRLKDSRNEDVRLLRVRADAVRRIVHQREFSTGYVADTLRSTDGRRLTFRGIRFRTDGVNVLTESDLVRIDFPQIDELHFSHVDFWKYYIEELAAYCPHLDDRLMQVETENGLVATTTMSRLRPMPFNPRDEPEQWFHLIQPAWCLDSFAVRHAEVSTRRFFHPNEVLLSRVHPASEVNRSKVHSAWPARANRNAYDGPLQNAGKRYGWGFGVHGACRLEFPLPKEVSCTFSTSIGLDDSVGDGGYARPSLWLAGDEDVRLFDADVLRGSQQTVHFSKEVLTAEDEERRLVLLVDPLNDEHPDDADPWDVRDSVNWLEPVLTLNREELDGAMRRLGPKCIPALAGWTVDPKAIESLEFAGGWDAQRRKAMCYRQMLRWQGSQPLELTRTMRSNAPDAQLVVSACRPAGSAGAALTALINGREAARGELPLRHSGEDEPRSVVVPLNAPAGEEVKLTLRVSGLELPLVVDWRRIAIDAAADQPKPVEPFDIWHPSSNLTDGARINKEAHNLLLEIDALLDANAYDDAAALIVKAPPNLLFARVPDEADQQGTITLAAAIASRTGADNELRRIFKSKYQDLADLRFSSAMISNDARSVEAAAVQFPGTPAAAQADAWLGDRNLSRGRFRSALEQYTRCLPDLPISRRASVRQRIALVESQLTSD